MDEKEFTPVQYAGMITFMNQDGVDVGPLEARKNTFGFIQKIDVVRGRYHCHYALSDDERRINALMIVSEEYDSEILETNEKIGSITVGLSGVVGYFASPKKEYSMYGIESYLADLEREYGDFERRWVNLNGKQFMAPCSQAVGTSISVFVHRNADGKIDALQMEFNRKETELLNLGREKVDNGR